jgi:hypothetical protein
MSGLPQTRKTPPDSLDANKQYDLFTTFFGKDKRDLSNTIDTGGRFRI